MADKTYVFVAPIGAKEVFDNKYKSTLPKMLNEAISKAIDRSSKLTTKEPADKKEEGLYLAGDLWLRQTDKGIEAELKMVLADWPKKSVFGGASSKSSIQVANPAKIDKDVDALIKGILDDVQAKVLKEFEKRAK